MPKQGKTRQPQKRNVTSWRPGQSGNSRGSPPKGASIGEAVRRLLATDASIELEPSIRAERVALVLYKQAVAKRPSIAAIRLLSEVAQVTELEERIADLEARLRAAHGEPDAASLRLVEEG